MSDLSIDAASDALRESEERFRLLIEAVKDYAIIFMDASGAITNWNDGAERFLGYTRGEVLGRNGSIFFTPEDQAEGLPERELATARLQGRAYDENWLVRKDGSRFWASGTSTALWDQAGHFRGFAKIFRDLSERKAAEELLTQRVQQRTQELQDRERVLQVAHSTSQEQARQLRDLATRLSRHEQSQKKKLAQLLHDHLQQLLVAAKMRVELAKADVQEHSVELLQEALAILDESIEATRTLTVQLAPPLLHDDGLPAAVKWLIERMKKQYSLLIDQSVDDEANPDGEELRDVLFQAAQELLLNVAKHAGTNVVSLRLARSEDQVWLIVADRGSGFDASAAMSHGSYGLFQIRQRLESVGGSLIIESEPGSGTSAAVTVPQIHPSSAQAVHHSSTGDIQDDRLIRVVVVDDHELVRRELVTILNRAGDIQVIAEAGDGQAGVETVLRLLPDVVVMDINMPVMNGIEAIRHIVGMRPEISVIGMNLDDSSEVLDAALTAGAKAFVSKENAAMRLAQLIREVAQENEGDYSG